MIVLSGGLSRQTCSARLLFRALQNYASGVLFQKENSTREPRARLNTPDGKTTEWNAIAAFWHGMPVQRCTVHKHRNLL